MPFARNPLDGCRVYFEDDGGDGSPVVVLNGLGDPAAASRAWGVTSVLSENHRMVFIDHRGHGGSDKPYEPAAYSTRLRVADVVAVLDEVGIERAHLIGLSWGARLLFGFGELAPERALTLTMAGQMPYAMDLSSKGINAVTSAFRNGAGMGDFIEALGGLGDVPDAIRTSTLNNDFQALKAAWWNAMDEGAVAAGLETWQTPCLIYAGTRDSDFFEGARRAAQAIPGAQFLALEGMDHVQAHADVDHVLPQIQALIDAADRSAGTETSKLS